MSDRAAKNALTMLTRLARRQPTAEEWLRRAFERHGERIAVPAIEIAKETGDPIGRLLAEYIEEHQRRDLALGLEPHLPSRDTVALRELSALVTAVAVERERNALVTAGAGASVKLARLLNSLGIRLSGLGRREEALAVAEEAVAIYRDLTAERPDAFIDLARSLSDLSIRLSALGRREESLAAAEEAVAIFRDLTAERPSAFNPEWARSLSNLGIRLSDLGRHEEALAAAQEAVALYRIWRQRGRTRSTPSWRHHSTTSAGICANTVGARRRWRPRRRRWPSSGI